jgi:hypothetical protein
METKMNELVIRLQYENSFLKEKLNSYPSLTQIGSADRGMVKSGNGHNNRVQVTNNHHLKKID